MSEPPDLSAVDQCERAVRRAIVSGEYAVGSRLPPERELAEQLGVNRTTLRAALARLTSARLLQVRQGSGAVVQDVRLVAGLSVLPDLAALAVERGDGLHELVRDLLEVRRRLALMVFERLLAEPPSPELVDRVADAVDRMGELPGSSTRAIGDADIAVTAALIDATRSHVLGLCLNPVRLVIHELEPLREHMYREPAGNVAAYRSVVAWLRSPTRAGLDMLIGALEARDRETARSFEPELAPD